jgi:hypothetical protein
MEAKQKGRGRKRHYKVSTIRNGQTSEQVLTRQERNKLDPNDVDVQIDEPRQEIWIQHKGATKSACYHANDMVGIGTREWNLLVEAVFSAGDVVPLKSLPHIHQRVARLRRLFRDSKEDEWFFITTIMPNYGIVVNTNRNWRLIEVLAE